MSFVCEKCLASNYDNLPSIHQSLGACDDCGMAGVCSDIQSGSLRRKRPAGKPMLTVIQFESVAELLASVRASKERTRLTLWESPEHIGVRNIRDQAFAIQKSFLDRRGLLYLQDDLRRALDLDPLRREPDKSQQSAMDKMDKLLDDDD